MSTKRREQAVRGSRHVTTPPVSVEAVCLGIAFAASGLLFWRSGTDLFSLPRATALAAVAAFLLGYWSVRAFRGQQKLSVDRAAGLAAAAVVTLLVLAWLTAPIGWTAALGVPHRGTGLVEYLSYVVLFIAAMQVNRDSLRSLSRFIVVVAGLVAAYGVLQWLGGDPLDWPRADLGTTFATFGQTNFAAGWAAVALPFALALPLDVSTTKAWRWCGAVVVVLLVLFIRATESFQGVAAGLAGSAVIAWALLPYHVGKLRHALGRIPRGAVFGAIAILFVLVALPQPRDYVRKGLDSGLNERLQLWDAATEMITDAPITGKGLGSYPVHFPEFRPADHGRDYAYFNADSPHNVPLEFGVNGGLPLLVAYLAFVFLVGRRLVLALRRDRDLLLATFGAAWFVYQVQSLVSFDVPALASTHWVLAGAVLVLSRSGERVSAGPARGRSRRAPLPSPVAAIVAGIAVVLVLSPWLTQPLRADRAARRAVDLAKASRVVEAVEAMKDATNLAPWNAPYWGTAANLYQIANRPDLAVEAAQTAIRKAPGTIKYRSDLARLAVGLGDLKLAEEQYEEAIRLDPHNSSLRAEIAAFNAEHKTSIGD